MLLSTITLKIEEEIKKEDGFEKGLSITLKIMKTMMNFTKGVKAPLKWKNLLTVVIGGCTDNGYYNK